MDVLLYFELLCNHLLRRVHCTVGWIILFFCYRIPPGIPLSRQDRTSEREREKGEKRERERERGRVKEEEC